MRAPDGKVRHAYAALAGMLDNLSIDSLVTKQNAAEELFRRLGITFAVYAEGKRAAKSWIGRETTVWGVSLRYGWRQLRGRLPHHPVGGAYPSPSSSTIAISSRLWRGGPSPPMRRGAGFPSTTSPRRASLSCSPPSMVRPARC